MGADRIRVSGKPRRDIDVDLLVQAILLIAEQRLAAEEHAGRDDDDPDADERRASA